MHPIRIGVGIPRGIGDPRTFGPPNHREMLAYGKLAEDLGFDSVWVSDHYYFERPIGTLTPYPEVWTLMSALAATTERVAIGSMVLSATFRHPALMAKMASALHELSNGRLILGIGAGNQAHEHNAFGLPFDRRVGRFEEYLEIMTGLLKGESVTKDGKFYKLHDATLRIPTTPSPVPLLIAGRGERMLGLAAKYGDSWNGGGAIQADGQPFVSTLASLHNAARSQGRNPDDIEITYVATTFVVPDSASVPGAIDTLCAVNGISPEQARGQFIVGTPDEVVARFKQAIGWGATHFIVGLGAQPTTLWSRDMLDLFTREVLPRLRTL